MQISREVEKCAQEVSLKMACKIQKVVTGAFNKPNLECSVTNILLTYRCLYITKQVF